MWTVATFRVTAFVVTVALYLHLSGSLPGRLAALDTTSGAMSFLALWTLTWFVTRVSLGRMEKPIEHASSSTIVFNAAVAGGCNGVGVFVAAICFSFVHLPGRPPIADGGVIRLILVLLSGIGIGGPLSFTVGAIAGLISGLFEALLLGLGSMVFSATRLAVVRPPPESR